MTDRVERKNKKNTQQSTNDSWSVCGKLSKSTGCTVVVDVMQFGVGGCARNKAKQRNKRKTKRKQRAQ